MKKKILIAIAVFLVIAQLFRIDKTNPVADNTQALAAIEKPSAEVSQLLKIACYDCHSNETEYPWYSNVAPVSWWMKKHISNGRQALNFSEWGSYPQQKKAHKMEECYEKVVEQKSMPLLSYWVMHPAAKLSPAQRKALGEWFREIGG